jgi:hypothetical protein
MFSIIICSINETYLNALKINISETIGHPYELLVWDNRISPKPIAEVYNILGKQAQYPWLCFIHEDIIFQTQNWAAVLLAAFQQDSELGMIGVAGAKYKSRTPSGWSTGITSLDCVHILHRNANGEIKTLHSAPQDKILQPVVNIDGVFISIRKEVLETVQFNEGLLKGFHLYDIDFSFRVVSKYRAAVTLSIDIIHLTEGGNYGNEWVEYTLRWHKVHAASLPVALPKIKPPSAVEKKIRRYWLRRLSKEKISWKNKIRWLLASGAWSDPFSWPNAGLFLFKKPFS